MNRWLSFEETCFELRLGPRAVLKMLKHGVLVGYRVPGLRKDRDRLLPQESGESSIRATSSQSTSTSLDATLSTSRFSPAGKSPKFSESAPLRSGS
jgi:hypothetical protein